MNNMTAQEKEKLSLYLKNLNFQRDRCVTILDTLRSSKALLAYMLPDKELQTVLSKGDRNSAISYYTGKLVGLSYAYNKLAYALLTASKR